MEILVIILAVMFMIMIPSAIRSDLREQRRVADERAELDAQRRAFVGF